MKRLAILTLLALGVLLLALAGWTVQGVRWTLSGGRRRRTALATA